MAQPERDVKPKDEHRQVFILILAGRCRTFFDKHPRTGWYIAIVSTVNIVLNLVQIFH